MLNVLFELFLCPVHGLLRDNINSFLVLTDSHFHGTLRWLKHKIHAVFYRKENNDIQADARDRD
jgi:hypothetical protein